MSSAAEKISRAHAFGVLAQPRCKGLARPSSCFRSLFRTERFAGKAFGWRLIGCSAAALIIPAIWVARGRRSAYPYASDILFVLPFLIDTVGNALDLYDTIDWWGRRKSLRELALLSGALAAALARTHIRGAELFGLVVGFGGVTTILWEIGEYFAFIRNSSELATAYTDTLGDMALGLSGSREWRPCRRSRVTARR
jgi:hypothetical protein